MYLKFLNVCSTEGADEAERKSAATEDRTDISVGLPHSFCPGSGEVGSDRCDEAGIDEGGNMPAPYHV